MPLQKNYPLLIGLTLSAVFIFIALFGARLAPYDPLQQFADVIRDGNGKMYIPTVTPVPPFTLDLFLLGTDNIGRDIWSRLLWAIRPTLLTCMGVVVARLLLSVPLGLLAGWYEGSWFERLLDTLSSTISAIPQLILAITFIALSPERPISIFILTLAAIGWVDMTNLIKNQTIILKKAEYIESARAIGATTGAILRRHIFPQLWPLLPAVLAFELSAVLLIMAELGFLGFFVGNGQIVYGADPNSAGLIVTGLTSSTPELGQMLADFWDKIFRSPWEMVVAATAIFLQVFSFNMLGEGLRRRLDVTRH